MASRTLSLAFELAGKLAPSFMESAKGATAQLKVVQKTAKEIQSKAEMRASVASWKSFTGSVKKAKVALGGVKSELSGIAKGVSGLVLGNGLLGASVYGIAKSSANYADAAVKNAQSAGMTVEGFTELAYAANMSGVAQQEFVSSSERLNRVITGALNGTKSAVDAFARAGVELHDGSGNLKSTEQLYVELADTIAGMPDGVDKTSLAMDLFGKSGAKLIPMLNSGKDGLAALRADAQRLGISLTEFDAKNAEAFNDSFANIGESIRGVTLIAGKHLWPVFTKIHDFISDKIVTASMELARVMPQWAAEMEKGWDALVPKLEEAWVSIKEGLKAANDFAQSMGGWIPLIKAAVEYWLYWRGIRIAKSLWDTGKAVQGLGRDFLNLQYAGTSVKGILGAVIKTTKSAALSAFPALSNAFVGVGTAAKAFGAALLANPVGLVIAGIIALGVAVYLCVKYWDDITAAMGKAWDWIKGVFVAGWDMLPGWIQEPLAAAAEAVGNFGKKVWSGIVKDWERIKEFFGPLLAGIRDIFTGSWDGIAEVVSSTMKTIDETLGTAGKWWGDFMASTWTSISGAFEKGWNMLPDWVRAPLSRAGASIAAFGGEVWDGIVAVWDRVSAALVGKFNIIGDAFENSFVGGLLEVLYQFNPLTIFMEAFTAVKDWLLGFDLASAGAALAQKLGDGILSAWNNIKGGIVSAVTDWIPGGESLVNAAGAAANGVSDAAGWVGDKLSSLIPAFADGGVVTRPQMAMIGEAGPEVVVPVTRPGRAAELMDAAAGMMGRRGEARGGAAATYTVEFKPSITIQGNADASVVERLERRLRHMKDEIMRDLSAQTHHERRVAFSG